MNHFKCLWFLGLVSILSPQLFSYAQPSDGSPPTELHLFPESHRILGWVSGDREASKITVEESGKQTEVVLGKDGCFEWTPDGESKTDAAEIKFSYGDKLTKTVQLPKLEQRKPVAFFIVDRSLVRPQNKSKFTAFIRQPDQHKASYSPIANEKVEVVFTSKATGIHVASIPLTSDKYGRITGDYTFSESDPFDEYRVYIRGYAGSASVTLAEFRKAKTKLVVNTERTDNEMLKLRFRTLNFQNDAVKAGQLKMKLEVKPAATKSGAGMWGYDPKAFAETINDGINPYSLSPEKRALLQAGFFVYPDNETQSPVHLVDEEIAGDGTGEFEYDFPIDPTWKFGHTLTISASVIDENDREQKVKKQINLERQRSSKFKLEVSNQSLLAGELLDITLSNPENLDVTLLSFRLQAGPEYPSIRDQSIVRDNNASSIRAGEWVPEQKVNSQLYPTVEVNRQFLSTLSHKPFAKKPGHLEAKTHFARAGAYMVEAVARDAEGKEYSDRKVITVRDPKLFGDLSIHLDSNKLNVGDKLQGTLHSRAKKTEALLVIRDGNGVKLLHPITTSEDSTKFSIDLPKSMTLGCEISARFRTETGTQFHSQVFLVKPNTKPLTVNSTAPKKAAPGKPVELEFQVNRKQPVDLVISVFDRSILRVAPDQPVDGRSLFWADTRVASAQARRMLEACLGDDTLSDILASAQVWLENNQLEESSTSEQKETYSQIQNIAATLKSISNNRSLNHSTVFEILKLRGIRLKNSIRKNWYIRSVDMNKPLIEYLQAPATGQTQLVFFPAGDSWLVTTAIWLNGELNFNEPDYSRSRFSFGDGSRLLRRDVTRGEILRGNDSFFGGLPLDLSTGYNSSYADSLSEQPRNEFAGEAHAAAVDAPATLAVRKNFSDSAFFNGTLRTDQTGLAKVTFDLPDSLTDWQVVVTAVTKDLAIARHTNSFVTDKPVMVWPMLSQVFTSGDKSDIFALVSNRTKKPQDFTVSTTVKNGKIIGDSEKQVRIKAGDQKRVYFYYLAGEAGVGEIQMKVSGTAGSDIALKKLPIHACKAEQVITKAGFTKGEHQLTIPDDIDLSQAQLDITISPSLAGDMIDSMGYLLAYPHGCVEQTMSRFLPTIKVTQILKRFEVEDPKINQLADRYSQAGIKRLLALQKPDGGWGWHGNSSTHEMMTPYALYGLIEAQKAGFTIPKDDAIDKGIAKLEQYIKASSSDRKSMDRIYCLWVYQHHGEIRPEWWQWLDGIANRTLSVSQDMSWLLSDYASALMLEMACKANRTDLANKLVQLMRYRAKGSATEAYWTTANFSRWGNDRFEITAAVLKALAIYNPEDALVPRTLNFFAQTKRGNKWNSTKDTAMILYALCEYLSTQKLDLNSQSTTELAINEDPFNVKNTSWQSKTITIPGDKLKNGVNLLNFTKSDPTHLYRIVFRHWENGNDIEPIDEGISVSRDFVEVDTSGELIRKLKDGDTVDRGAIIKTTLSATSNKGLNFALAANPKPSCAEFTEVKNGDTATAHALRELKNSGAFWHHENAKSNLQNNCTYRMELAGDFQIAPAYAELMYDTAVRGSSGSFRLIVADAD